MKIAVVALVALLVAQSSQVSLFEGHWRTDVPAELGSIALVPSGVGFAVQPGKVTITRYSLQTSDHRTVSDEESLETDGKPHQTLDGQPGATSAAKWSSPYLLEITYTSNRRDGINTIRLTYTISADQKTLTERGFYPSNHYTYERAYYR